MKKIFFAIFACLISLSAHAQLGGGAKVGYNVYLDNLGIKTPALSVFGTYNFDGSTGVRVGLQYGLPVKNTQTFSARALDNFSNPQRIDVEGTTTLNSYYIFALGKRYFFGGDYDDGGLYGGLGVGYNIVTEQTDYEEYSNVYSVTGRSDEEDKFVYQQMMIQGLVGYELDLSVTKLFVEGGIVFPLAEYTSRSGLDAELAGFVEVSVGVRF